MIRVTEDDEDYDRFNRYVGTLFEEAIKTKQNLTSDQIATYVRDKMVDDIRNRVSAILAIGSEVGSVSKNDSGRYFVSKGILQMDAALDKCYKPLRCCSLPRCWPLPRGRPRCYPPTCFPLPVCCAPCCCYRKVKAYSRRKKRVFSGYLKDDEKLCQEMSGIGELNR